MTVAQLSRHLTNEELVSWSAYYQLKQEHEDKAMERAKQRGKSATMRSG